MIFGKVQDIDRFVLPQAGFAVLKSYLKRVSKIKFIKGRFEIEEEQVFGIGLEYETKGEDECIWEAHRKYIDIHVVLEGEEQVLISGIENMKSTKSYDTEGDYELFEGKKEHRVLLKQGEFLILFPNEVHKTGVLIEGRKFVKKLVAKLAIS